MEELLKNQKIAVWVVSILLMVISFLMGLGILYLKSIFKETKSLSSKIGKNNYAILSLQEKINGIFSALHSSEKSLWDEILKLRRAVVSGTVVLKRRREETDKFVEDTRRLEGDVAKNRKILSQALKVLRRNRGELDLHYTKIIDINEDIKMIKSVKK